MEGSVSTQRKAKENKGSKSRRSRRERGLQVSRRWTKKNLDPYDQIEWEMRSALITGPDGQVIFEQKDIEVPKSWTQLATNVVVSKYFKGAPNTPERETSVRQMIDRVVDEISKWGRLGGYFASKMDRDSFHNELKFLLVNQYASFNSPVWFNVGLEKRPQCSACFINSVEDNMGSILELAKTEGMLFRYGSGTGTNLSPVRASSERTKAGGTASGPVSFMRGYDAFAGVIKSGGKTRRAAKMVILDVDHPDIIEFVESKSKEEKKAWALIDSGYDGSFDGDAYRTISFQNGNHSVRVPDEFMEAVGRKGRWETINRTDGAVASTHKADELLELIATHAHQTGDPGIQFDTEINKWHTCKGTDRIYASNPCSEYMFLNDSACNLASLNLMKYRLDNGDFDVDGFKHAVGIVLTAQEIIVGNASYPTKRIEKNSLMYRPLGLGFANLGALLMAKGLPYDSEEGRAYAGAITSIMCGEAYAQSARIAEHMGAFEGYEPNANSMLEVMRMHEAAVEEIDSTLVPASLLDAAKMVWGQAVSLGEKHGYRNSQATVLAPTGTIGFMMDCDTTGIEPDISLIKYKKLVGGGMLKIVNQTVPLALAQLGYSEEERQNILDYLEQAETIEGAPGLRDEDLPVFDCAFKPLKGERTIEPMGHVRMMAAAQPFLSGAISKTVNMPTEATVEDIKSVYTQAWNLGLKAIAIYRDGCKRSQPLNTSSSDDKVEKSAIVEVKPRRKRLSDERQALTHKFSIAGHEGYITVGLYDDGMPGEVFIRMSKEGSTISGLMDSFATSISMALQYGVPLSILTGKFSHTRYEPSGFTGNRDIPIAKSITDYIFRWLALKFLKVEEEGIEADSVEVSTATQELRESANLSNTREAQEKAVFTVQADAPSCSECGTIMVRNGACYKCINCGSTSGCS